MNRSGYDSREPKAKRMFFSVEDVSQYFDKNLDRLADYVETGARKRIPIVSTHLVQLSGKVGIPLLHDGRSYSTLPEIFVDPNGFKNIGLVLRAAREIIASH